MLVSSPLRRAASTVSLALGERLHRSAEPVRVHSACQEISRNVDTMGLATAAHDDCDAVLATDGVPTRFDASDHAGNKTLALRGIRRLEDFASWAAGRPERAIIVGGHSLWFRSFFARYLTRTEHPAAKRKMVNCGVVAFTLSTVPQAKGTVRHFIRPESISVVYGGFATK